MKRIVVFFQLILLSFLSFSQVYGRTEGSGQAQVFGDYINPLTLLIEKQNQYNERENKHEEALIAHLEDIKRWLSQIQWEKYNDPVLHQMVLNYFNWHTGELERGVSPYDKNFPKYIFEARNKIEIYIHKLEERYRSISNDDLERELLVDGITLTYQINEGNFDVIENYIRKNGYVHNQGESDVEYKFYEKKINTNSSLSLFITENNAKYGIGFIYSDKSGGFMIDKIKSKVYRSSQFKVFESEKESFVFFVPKHESTAHDKPYEFAIILSFDDNIISFFPPVVNSHYWKWEEVIPKLLSDI